MSINSKGFRVVFVNLKTRMPCYFAGSSFTLEHIGLGYLSSFLRQHGYEVVIIDAATRDMSDEEVIREILDCSPSMVGFSPTVATMGSAIKISNLLKKTAGSMHICLGGHHATFLAEQILREEECFDSVVRGEGELTVLELANRLCSGSSLKDTLGLYFRNRGGDVSKNPGRDKIIDLDSIPFPARDALKWQVERGKSPTARVISSRGCVANCSFCSIPRFERLQKGRRWRARSADNVLDELTYLKEKFHIKTVLFAEDNFIGTGSAGKKRVRQIAEGILSRELGIRFRILCTTESLIACESLLPLLKKAGLDRVIVGIESASPNALKIFKKKATVEQHYCVAGILTNHSIVLHLGFIMFNPYSSFDDLRLNAEFLGKINQACFFQYFSNRMELYPGVGIFRRLEKEKMILSKSEYKRGFLYRYAEPCIEKLARGLSPIRRNRAELDRSLLDIDIRVSRNGNDDSKSDFIRGYSVLRKGLSARNMEFFLSSVELAESGWSPDAFEELKDMYMNDTEKMADELRSMLEVI